MFVKTVYVTILILVDGFLQLYHLDILTVNRLSHNPYFSRWFSAINTNSILIDVLKVTILILVDGFLQ